ncbi:MAG: MCP four helix bundle domain-containing protein [Gemmatimonadaceae bacterium]|nr:MCP four helix bundle domain-containing protein [Gemmatimonadaceae bacterium]
MVRWFQDLRIRSKLLVTVGLVLLGTAGLGILAERGLSDVNDQSVAITRDWLTGVERIGELAAQVQETRAIQYSHIAAISAEDMTAIEGELAEQSGHIKKAEEAYDATIILATDSALFRNFKAAYSAYDSAWGTVQSLSRAGKNAEARLAMHQQVEPKFEATNTTLAALVKLNHDESIKATELAASIYSRTRLIMVGVIVTLLIVGFGLAWWTGSMVDAAVQPIVARLKSLQDHCVAGLRRGLIALSSGDTSVVVTPVTTPIKSEQLDEIGQISRTFDTVLADIQTAVRHFGETQGSIGRVIAENQGLVNAAQRGQLAERAQVEGHEGAFRALVAGMNDMLEAVSQPIAEAQHVLAKVADKDLTARITGHYEGDYLTLKNSVNTAIHNLSETLEQVTAAAEQVAAASSQIASASQSLAGGASEQAASIEEIASSSTEFSSMAKSTAANTQEAQALAERARQNAIEGSERMQKLTAAVQEIRRGSVETAKIVKTIEEIAFQTNLLALNAAVEAARAGDAGRGFAVVAEEVRALAIRSAEASKNTASLIEQALQSAEHGVSLNTAAATSFDAIRGDVAKVADVVAEISAASQQQVEGVQQINGAIDQLNSATQHVASNAEESASTAEELSSQAAVLNAMVSRFTLEHDAGSVRAAAHAEYDRNHAKQQAAWQRAAAPARGAKAARPTAPMMAPKFASKPVAKSSKAIAQDLIPFDDESMHEDLDTLSVF